ncbi:MAG TPA: MliC family protein [Pseudorhodoplanes sp.]|jgi:membrane-bound inhibitor of C-type lysozyme|nr:MliC family protein [Pseudorhodoplanes sp.]
MRLVMIAVAVAVSAGGAALAQDFVSYRCADGTVMPVVFYRDVANVQLDGKALRLPRRPLSVSGARYAGQGVTLRISGKSISLKRKGEPRVACVAE